MNNCKHLKLKLNRKIYCTKLKKEITFNDCRGCEFKVYKSNNNCKKQPRTSKIKSKSSKLAKLERERFSLFSDDNTKCFICGSDYDLTWHEIFRGRNRLNSMRYGLCLRLCLYCHEKYQEDKEFNDYWHIKGQVKFEEIYPDLEFIDIFGRNYLD